MKISGIIFLLLLAFSAFGDEDYKDLFNQLGDVTSDSSAENDTSESPLKKKPVTIGLTASLIGTHIFELHIPVIKDHMNFDGYIKSPKFKNDFGIEVFYKKISLITHWQFDLILNQWGEGEKLLEIIPQENYLSWAPWKFFFAVGFLNYNWGVADMINPTDNLNLKDIREPYEPKSLPSFSVYAKFFPVKMLSLELIYIPFYLSLPVNPAELVAEKLNTGSDNISPRGTVAPEYFGIGGKASFFLRHIDFSFSYVTQIDPFYSIDLDLTQKGAAGFTYYAVDSATLINTRVHNFGTDLKAAIDIVSLWLEFCFTLSEDIVMTRTDRRNHQMSWTTGVDFNYGPNSAFYFNFQHFGKFNMFFDKTFYQDYDVDSLALNKDRDYYETLYYRTIVNNLGLRQEGILLGAALVMKWPLFNEMFTPSFRAVYSFPLEYDMSREIRCGSLYIKSELDIMPVDSFHILIGTNMYLSWYKPSGENVQLHYGDITGANYGSGNVYLVVKYQWGIHFKH